MSNPDFVSAFRAAMLADGIPAPAEIMPDGKLHRCSTNGKRDDDSGWYVLHTDGIPAGAYGDWRTGIENRWRANVGRKLSPAEKAQIKRRDEEAQRQREAEKAEAARNAASIWTALQPARTDHPYLVRKKISANGAKQRGEELVVPLRDATGKIHSLQFIGPDGEKLFLRGGAVTGFYHGIAGGDPLCIAEGFATGASIHEATGCAVAIAFNAGNLEAVAMAARLKFPDKRLVICADDDYRKAGNPGIQKATCAARATGALLAVPDFGADRPDCATDFNDLANRRGTEAVKLCIASAKPVDNEPPTPSGNPGTERVELLRGDAIEPEAIAWLWEGWLALGKVHLLAGQVGTGKTTLALAFAAKITTGGEFPDGARAPKGSVLMWSGEDGHADSLIPRFMANGGDRQRIYIVKGVTDGAASRPFDPSTDFAKLVAAAEQISDLALVIIDPIVSAVPGDSHKNAEVRRSLQPLADFGAEAKVAVLGISHFSKGTAGREPIERVIGSLAFVALPRVVLATAKPKDPDEPSRLIRAKSNIGPDGGGFEYRLERTLIAPGSTIIGQAIRFGEALEGTARELLAEAEAPEGDDDSRLAEAKRWVETTLAEGPIVSRDIRRLADDAGLSWPTVRRAQKALGIKPRKTASSWLWEMPREVKANQGAQDAQDAHSET